MGAIFQWRLKENMVRTGHRSRTVRISSAVIQWRSRKSRLVPVPWVLGKDGTSGTS
jgi:hypothetical protein